jgi:glycosyltransferase involved in cell wall biosynthesis
MNTETSIMPSRVAWVIAKLTAGGIGPVCRYAAEGVAGLTTWSCTVVILHEPPGDWTDNVSGVRFVSLGLGRDASREFLRWLDANPQDVIITSDVCHIETSFPFFPKDTLHVIQIHDSLRRYRDVAVRNQSWADGIFCVARHIEAPLRASLAVPGYHGLLTTVHNGAAFPPVPARASHDGPLRLLYMGRMDPFKGVLDIAPILKRLTKLNVAVRLTIVGGEHTLLARRLRCDGLEHLVTWTGIVPHQECYRLAANSDVFLMLSRREPFGMVTIEAMSMGCVPISYDTPSGSTEIIENGQSGVLVPLGDFRAVAQSVKDLHENRNQLLHLSQGAMQRARTHFSHTYMASHLCEFLEEVRTHASKHPSERLTGRPPETSTDPGQSGLRYNILPASIRDWVRNRVGTSPRLSYWLLSHWRQ